MMMIIIIFEFLEWSINLIYLYLDYFAIGLESKNLPMVTRREERSDKINHLNVNYANYHSPAALDLISSANPNVNSQHAKYARSP